MEVIIDGVQYVPACRTSMSTMTLGEMLKWYRERSRLSMSDAAEQARTSKTYLWKIEAGRSTSPSWPLIVRIAELYGASLDDLARCLPSCDSEADKPQ